MRLRCSSSFTGCFLRFLLLPVLLWGTGWLLYLVPFGWVLALTIAVVWLHTVPVVKERFCYELPTPSYAFHTSPLHPRGLLSNQSYQISMVKLVFWFLTFGMEVSI